MPSRVLFYSLILTLIIGFVLHKTIGFRVSEEDELAGVDGSEHAETGYDLGTLSAGLRGRSFGGSPQPIETASVNKDEEVSA